MVVSVAVSSRQVLLPRLCCCLVSLVGATGGCVLRAGARAYCGHTRLELLSVELLSLAGAAAYGVMELLMEI